SRSALVVQQAVCRCWATAKCRKITVQARIVRRSHSCDTSFHETTEASRDTRVGPRSARRDELSDHRSPIRHENVLSRPHRADDLAQAILEFADANGLHAPNVAPRGYIVNSRGWASGKRPASLWTRALA